MQFILTALLLAFQTQAQVQPSEREPEIFYQEGRFLVRRYFADMERLQIPRQFVENPILFAIWKAGHDLNDLVEERRKTHDPILDGEVVRVARTYLRGEQEFRSIEGINLPMEMYKLLSLEASNEINFQVTHRHECPALF